jgi:hypothetical protein
VVSKYNVTHYGPFVGFDQPVLAVLAGEL